MNKFFGLIFICALAFGMSSCGSDDNDDVEILNYDGDNVTGPFFQQGAYATAARFPSATTSLFEGQILNSVELYILEQPSSANLTIYRGDGSTAPVGEISSQSLGSLTTNSWNTITLDTPYTIDGTEIWIGIEFSLDSGAQVIGCDAGPANRNGDYLLQNSDGIWTTFRDLTVTESINWNIRGVLSAN